MAKKYIDEKDLDFLKDDDEGQDQGNIIIPRKKSGKKGLILFLSIFAFVLSSFLYVQASASPLSQGLKTFPWIQSLTGFMKADEEILIGEANDAINILLIGMGGAGHDGGFLADTIILIRFKPSTKQVALLSFPRDLAVNIPQHGWRKINNANAYGGSDLLTEMMSEVIGDEVPYYVMVDFDGFENIIDDLGGVDIYVERSFTDSEYPDNNHEFQTVSFKKGMQHMTGAEALIFSRSRHGDNGEGSDFARQARQQKILFALKEKATSVNTILNPTKLITLYNNLSKYIETNVEPPAIIRLAQLSQGTRQSGIVSHVFIDGPQGHLKATIGDEGAYLLIPKEGLGNYSVIQNLIATIFDQTEIAPSPEYVTQEETTEDEVIEEEEKTPEPEEPKVVILNGTTIPGYAASLANQLTQNQFEVLKAANHYDQSYDKTKVYKLKNDTPNSFEYLEDLLKFNTDKRLKDDLESYVKELTSTSTDNIDYVIILGLDNQQILNY